MNSSSSYTNGCLVARKLRSKHFSNISYLNFKMSTLIMTGENEVGSTPLMSEGISKEINNSELYIIKNAKHGATIEQAEAVNQKLNNFLF